MNNKILNLGAQGLEANNAIRERISQSRAVIKKDLSDYAEQVKELKIAEKNKSDASKKYEKKQNLKNETRFNEALNTYKSAYSAALITLNELTEYIAALEKDWNKLIFQISILDVKSAPKEQNEFGKFKKIYETELNAFREELELRNIELTPTVKPQLEVAEPIYETAESNGYLENVPRVYEPKEEKLQPAYEKAESINLSTKESDHAGVSLAPISIDISSYVERAVNQAMEKMSSALDSRIDEYLKAYSLKIGVGGGISAETANLQSKIADDEKFLLDKLVGIVEVLKKLNTEIATLSSSYSELDSKVREISELQKETNDMQRHTLREQQGVQVNQRIVNKDQLAIAEEQMRLTDGQKVAADEQKRISSSQSAVAENQKAILETQSSIEEAMKALMQEQKRIISSHQQIVAENAKQLEAHKLIGEKQNEIAEEQKAVLAEQKLRLKEQKALGAKVKPKENA